MKTINFNENNHVVRNEGLDLYMSQMNARKPLTDDEVRELIIKAQKGDERARNKVVEANLRIAQIELDKSRGELHPPKELLLREPL